MELVVAVVTGAGQGYYQMNRCSFGRARLLTASWSPRPEQSLHKRSALCTTTLTDYGAFCVTTAAMAGDNPASGIQPASCVSAARFLTG